MSIHLVHMRPLPRIVQGVLGLRHGSQRHPPIRTKDDLIGRAVSHNQRHPGSKDVVFLRRRGRVAPGQVERSELHKCELGLFGVMRTGGGEPASDRPGPQAQDVAWAEKLEGRICDISGASICHVSKGHCSCPLQPSIDGAIEGGQPQRPLVTSDEPCHCYTTPARSTAAALSAAATATVAL